MRVLLALILFSAVTTGALAQTVFTVSMDGSQANAGAGTGSGFVGSGTVTLNLAEDMIDVALTHDVPNGNVIGGHIHLGDVGVSGGIVFPFVDGMSPITETHPISPGEVAILKANGYYVNIHTVAFVGGEIRGQIVNVAAMPLKT